MTDHTLAEFEAWCKGEGRGGKKSGRHYTTLTHIENFRACKERERLKILLLEKQLKTAEIV